ncbi:bifunctional folylpolyglutamate synthase/dihydrofolate synthase [Lawsonibacter sp. LCP25S3_G6]|uniref:bifunctional folylpolyglutamate synthase/dihydrofolate synthase n=1 Tax=unclassified Lawsonibacter TaxID=2617946 RepID=UPI003F9D97B9
MTAQEAEQRIHEQAWIGRTPGLERTRELLGRLGDPHMGLKFVHITGTNGKGSTAAMVSSVLQKAGFKTGLYTSPHLWYFGERFQINGVPIADTDLGRITELVLKAAQNMTDPATEFELMTAVAMVYFKEQNCDIVVLEVGLGGRLDSTNIIPAPEVAVITNLGLEHTDQLGHTIPLIAKEKAGIIKPGCRCVLYHQSREAEAVVEEVCREKGVELTVTDLASIQVLEAGAQGQRFLYRGVEYRIPMVGAYQVRNASTAIEVVEALRRGGWMIAQEALSQGLAKAAWPGRMELAHQKPDLIIDGGHNPQCMEAIAQSLPQLYPGKKIRFLVGVMGDKDYGDMMDKLLPLAHSFVTLTPDSPRALSAGDLAAFLKRKGAQATPCESVEEGLHTILAQSSPEDVICACGSLYMVGELRHLLGLC